MGLFTWMFSIIPDAILNWVYWSIIVVGLTGVFAGWFGRFIPVYGRYVEYLKPIGIVLLVLGVWLRGGYDVEMAWRSKVAEAEAKVAQAEQKSQELNANLVAEQKKKQKVRVEYYNTVKTQIQEVEKQINADCKLDPKVNELVNKAAKNPEAKQ
jgi:preprotein translocase subunit SecF